VTELHCTFEAFPKPFSPTIRHAANAIFAAIIGLVFQKPAAISAAEPRMQHNFGATQATQTEERPSWRSSQRGPESQAGIVWVHQSWRPFSFRSANGA
jgi:hypothetical protein